MLNPTSSKINTETTVSLNQGEGYIYITSVVKNTNMTIGDTVITNTVIAQEFYSPIRCTSFTASLPSVTYKIAG